jgi:hypothetical protein
MASRAKAQSSTPINSASSSACLPQGSNVDRGGEGGQSQSGGSEVPVRAIMATRGKGLRGQAKKSRDIEG